MELSTFGAILRFAIELEKGAAAYYERAAQAAASSPQGLSDLAQAHHKRRQLAEQTRRENVTEMILEPIYGLREEDWRVDLEGAGWGQAVALEGKLRGFYIAAAAKVSIPQVARILRRMAEENARLEEQARVLG